ncbi:MAG: hypothetical protein HY683_03195 [Chloroflexi bacterium]|nr:hypothetical protein [Chloroflexota bacterium]
MLGRRLAAGLGVTTAVLSGLVPLYLLVTPRFSAQVTAQSVLPVAPPPTTSLESPVQYFSIWQDPHGVPWAVVAAALIMGLLGVAAGASTARAVQQRGRWGWAAVACGIPFIALVALTAPSIGALYLPSALALLLAGAVGVVSLWARYQSSRKAG